MVTSIASPMPGCPTPFPAMLTADRPIHERLEIGKAEEQFQIAVMRFYKWEIEEITNTELASHEDMVLKIDCWFKHLSVRYSMQLKGRDDSDPEKRFLYRDLLKDKSEPYWGMYHPLTVFGRDSLERSNCKLFTNRVGSVLSVVHAAAYKKIEIDVMEEWVHSEERERVDAYLEKWEKTLHRDYDDMPKVVESKDLFRRFPTMYSSRYPGDGGTKRAVQVKCTQDRKNRRPKLLIFTPPSVFQPGEITSLPIPMALMLQYGKI